MAKCTFCGNQIEKGTGKMYVRRDGTIYYFCSNRCEKNMLKLGRVGRTLKWTTSYKDFKKTEHAATKNSETKTETKGTPAKKSAKKTAEAEE